MDKQAEPEKFDLDIGDGHWIQWTEYEGERCGGIIRHTDPKAESGMCAGAFFIKSLAAFTNRPVWQMSGTFECPTLTPSFMCHCGDHGFVRNGRWVRA
jgi:hypothetical protein